jgi:hypothetical protein
MLTVDTQIMVTRLSDSAGIKKAGQRRYFVIGGSDARTSMGNDEAAVLRLRRDMRHEVEQGDLPLCVATRDPNQRWYEAIAGGVPSGWYLVTVCYAITVISLGWYPSNFLLIGLLFLIRNKPLRERARRPSWIRMLIGLARRRVVYSALNNMKTTFAVSRSWR